MASFSTTSSNNYRLTLTVTETAVNNAANTSTVSWSLALASTGNYSFSQYRIGHAVVINGSYVVNVAKANASQYSCSKGGSVTIASGSGVTIPHNSDGTKTISVSFSIDMNSASFTPGAMSGSGSMVLTNIPRYASITSFSVSKRDETSVTVAYAVSATCDVVQYKIGSGAWTNLPSSKVISGLSAGTTYSFTLRVRRTDSGLYTTSSAYSQTTYGYPSVVGTPPTFTIGSPLTISLYNPLGRSVTVDFIRASDNTVIKSNTTSGTSVSDYTGTAFIAALYSGITSGNSGTYQIKVTYGSHIATSSIGTYTGDSTNLNPLIVHEITDTRSETVAATGDPHKFIKYCSNAEVEITGIGKNGAGIIAVKVNDFPATTVPASDAEETLTDTFPIPNIETRFISLRVQDTRYNITDNIAEIVLIDYIKPTANPTVQRTTPTGDTAELTVTGSYYNQSFGAQSNILNVQYRVRENGGTFGSLVTMTPTINEGNTYTATITVPNLNYQKQYEIEVTVADRFTTVVKTTQVMRGIPIFDWGENDFNFNVPVNFSAGASGGQLDKIDTLDETVAQLSTLVGGKLDVSKVHKINAVKTTNFNTALMYSGLSVTIPKNSVVVFTATARYGSYVPKVVAVSQSSTNVSGAMCTGTYSYPIASTTLATITVNNPITYYVWAQYATAGNSTVGVNGFYIELD